MTVGEFKAYIEGMDIDCQPTEEEWARLMVKVHELFKPSDVSVPVKFEMPAELGLPPYSPPYTVT